MLTRPVPKYDCQTRLTNTRAVVGDPRSTSQRAKASRVGSQPSGSGCRTAGTPGETSLPGLSQSPRLSIAVVRLRSRAIKVRAVVPSGHCLQRASIRVVGLLEFGDGRPPVGEDDGLLGGRPPGGGMARISRTLPRERVGDRVLGGRHAQAEPAEVALLVVVVVPAAVLAHQVERQDRAGGEGDLLLGDEDRLTVRVAAAGAGVDAPGGVLLAVDGEFDPAR